MCFDEGSNSHVALWVDRTCKVFGPSGPSLTNRMTELVTYGSVGGVGRKLGPYPASRGVAERRNNN